MRQQLNKVMLIIFFSFFFIRFWLFFIFIRHFLLLLLFCTMSVSKCVLTSIAFVPQTYTYKCMFALFNMHFSVHVSSIHSSASAQHSVFLLCGSANCVCGLCIGCACRVCTTAHLWATLQFHFSLGILLQFTKRNK